MAPSDSRKSKIAARAVATVATMINARDDAPENAEEREVALRPVLDLASCGVPGSVVNDEAESLDEDEKLAAEDP